MLLPLAIEYSFWNESRPEALARFGTPIATGRERGVADWQALLEGALMATMDALAVESAARTPGLFVPLLRGGAGVGGIYDAQRRVRALLARNASPSYAAEELGNDASALLSVPAAVHAFLQDPDHPGDVVRYAIRAGGDADTIASMAGALAGARSGTHGLPPKDV